MLLLGAYGRGNAGDDVFLHSALELFKDRDIYINSADDSLLPDVAKGKVKTISTISPRDIFKKLRLYFRIKEVVYFGGDLWVELYGTKTPRQLLYKMVLLNTALRLSGKRVYYIGCGIGNLHGFSLKLARLSAKMAKKIIVREARTVRVLNLPTVQLLPDLAINLPYHNPARHKLSKGKFHIIISLLHSIPYPEKSFPKLIQDVAAFIQSLPEDRFKVSLLPMHMTEHEDFDDLWASKELLKLLPNKQIDIIYERDLKKTIDLLRDCQLVVGGRLHANILAILNGTPAIGISYRPKVKAFFSDNGLGQYCLELEETAKLSDVFQTIYSQYDSVANDFFAVSNQNLEKRKDYQRIAQEI